MSTVPLFNSSTNKLYQPSPQSLPSLLLNDFNIGHDFSEIVRHASKLLKQFTVDVKGLIAPDVVRLRDLSYYGKPVLRRGRGCGYFVVGYSSASFVVGPFVVGPFVVG